MVVGSNPGWKQGFNMDKKNNQKFVQIPFYRITQMLENKAQRYGIRFVEQEGSYTSKASYLDNDAIPVYGVNDAEAAFFLQAQALYIQRLKKT